MPFDGVVLSPLEQTLQQNLIKARGLVEAGWCKNDLTVSKYGKEHFCITGAIRQVLYGSPYGHAEEDSIKWTLEVHMRTALFAPYQYRTRAVSLEEWNDMKSRRKKEVVAAFDRAIVGVEHDAALKARRAPAGGW